MSLHPHVRAFLDERNRADPHIDYSRIAVPELRACLAIPASVAPSGTQSLRIEEHRIAVRSGEIGLRLYLPPTFVPAPITVFFHGGGFCIGDLDTTDSPCRFGLLKRERVHHRRYRTHDEAQIDLFDYMERFHNPRMRRRVARRDREFSALIKPSAETG